MGTLELREIRARRVSADTITEVAIKGAPVIFYAGKSDGVRVIGLSIRAWAREVQDVYRHRHPLRVGREGLTETTLLAIVTNQVDEDWKPNAYGILTVGDTDGMYLVPENAFWRDALAGCR